MTPDILEYHLQVWLFHIILLADTTVCVPALQLPISMSVWSHVMVFGVWRRVQFIFLK